MLQFLNNLDEDIRFALLSQLRNLWTHSSTAIEGNTLTLGETAFVIEEGLTVSGKPLKDHQEVVGHAKAIEHIYQIVEKPSPVNEEDLFNLHKAVQTEIVVDVYKPVGGWKKEPNGTYMVDGDKQLFFEYAAPDDVPKLMGAWIDFLNTSINTNLTIHDAYKTYADLHLSFVRIHPFFDGNGRMARLISNIPVLKSGHPPILIPKLKRRDYILTLSQYELSTGTPTPNHEILPINDKLEKFREFCLESWKDTIELVEEAHRKQKERISNK